MSSNNGSDRARADSALQSTIRDDFKRRSGKNKKKKQHSLYNTAKNTSALQSFTASNNFVPRVPRNQFRGANANPHRYTKIEGFLNLFANIDYDKPNPPKLNFKLVCPQRFPSLMNIAHWQYSNWSLNRVSFTFSSFLPKNAVAIVTVGLDPELDKVSPKGENVSKLPCSIEFSTANPEYPVLDSIPYYSQAVMSTASDLDNVDKLASTAPFRLVYYSTYTAADGTQPPNHLIGRVDISYDVLLLNPRDSSRAHESPGDLDGEQYTLFPREPVPDNHSTDTIVKGNLFCRSKVRKDS